MKKLCVFCSVILLCQIQILGQPGSLDQNFGTDGKVDFIFSNQNGNAEFGQKCFPLPGNKMLVVFKAGFYLMASRLLEDGSVDNTYGQNGYSEITENMIGHSCAVQNDGGLVICGGVFVWTPGGGGSQRLAVGKLTSDGLLDTTFSGDGLLVLNDHVAQQSAIQILLQPDNKIVLGDLGKLIRLNPDGTLDNTFGNNGVVVTSFANYGNVSVTYVGLLINTQNKIIAVGTSYNSYYGIRKTYLIRYNPDGSLDNTLDADGILVVNFNLSNDPTINAAHLQTDGKVLMTGSIMNPSQRDGLIARFLDDGSFDPTFNTTGYVIADLGLSYDEPCSIFSGADGKILICTRFTTSVARFNSNGSLDLTFGNNGIMVPSINNGSMDANHIVAVNSNDIFVIGINYNGPRDCTVLNLLNDGTLDNTFNEDGIAQVFLEGTSSMAINNFSLSNGKIFSIGNITTQYPDTLSFARFLSDGTPDPSFGSNGKIVTTFKGYQRRAIMQQDEKFLVPVTWNNAIAITRFNDSGVLDLTFSSDGIVTFPSIPGYTKNKFISMSMQSDGSILVVLEVLPQSGNYFYYNYSLAVFRLHPDGTLDNLFGTNGVQVIPSGNPNSYPPRAFSDANVMERVDGKIVVTGTLMLNAIFQSDTRIFLARFNADGSFDMSFDGDGSLVTNQFTFNGLSSLVLNDNKIVVASSYSLYQFNEDGTLDNAFGDAGIVLTYPNYGTLYGNIVRQQDGKIIRKGLDAVTNSSSYLSRYLADGTLDLTFGDNGYVLIPADGNFGPRVWEDASLFEDFLLVGGTVKSPFDKAIILKFSLSDVQLNCNNDTTVYTDLGICSASVNSIDPILVPVNSSATVQYSMSGATTGNGTGSVSGMLFNAGVTTVSYTLASAPQQTCSFTVTVNAPVNPPMSISTSDTANDFCNGILLTANADVPVLSYSWSDGTTTQTNFLTSASPSGTYTVNAILECGSITPAEFTYDKEALTSSYTLLAINTIKLQQNNTVVNGSVGVVNTTGSATIKKNVSIDGPGAFLKAQNITLQAPYNIPSIVYAPASGTLPTMQYNTTSINGLPNATVPNNTVITLVGNYKNITIGTNCNVTLTGSIFGSITIGSGSLVLFTQASIDLTALTMNAGTNSTDTQVKFNGDAVLRCAGSMLIKAKCVVNADNYKVVMYLGKTNGAPVSFTVDNGGDIVVNTSIYIPSGKISVGGDANNMTFMSGKFIAENIETLDKNVIWDWFDCEIAPVESLNITASHVEYTSQIITPAQEKQTVQDKLTAQETGDIILQAWPNPSNNEFTLYVKSSSNEPVDLSVFDITGREVYSAEGPANEHYQFGSYFETGFYIAFVRQGFNCAKTAVIRL